MLTARRVRLPFRSSSAAIISDEVPSAVACGPHESGNEFGFHNAIVNVGKIAAAEGKSGRRRHRKKREDGTPKNQQHKTWEERCNELAVYKETNDTCNVPQKQGALGNWVMHQRQLHNKGKLSQERTIQLKGIGFNWGARKKKSDAEQWEGRYNKLAAYKEENGKCNVP